MGINKPDIGWVVHYDPPDGVDAYVQEAGRAARQPGLTGTCLMMFTGGDLARRQGLLSRSGGADLGLAQRLLDRIARSPQRNGHHLVDIEQVAGELQVDEEDLNRLAAWLEDIGNLERLPDAIARLHLTWGGREPAEPDDRRAFVDLVTFKLKSRIGTRRYVEIDENARAWRIDPDRLEEQLVDWSLAGWLSLGVTQRRWRIRLEEPQLRADALGRLTDQWRRLQQRRLAELRRYLQDRSCRRTSIATAFGDEPRRCTATDGERCDVCDGGQPPWHAVPAASVPDPEQLVDIRLVVLQTVRWASRGTGRYSEANLKRALLGSEMAGQRPLPAGLLRCPQFGAVRFVHGATRELDRAVDGLIGDGLLDRRTEQGMDREYGVLELTGTGRAALGVGHG